VWTVFAFQMEWFPPFKKAARFFSLSTLSRHAIPDGYPEPAVSATSKRASKAKSPVIKTGLSGLKKNALC
jgi:hypothetical protein